VSLFGRIKKALGFGKPVKAIQPTPTPITEIPTIPYKQRLEEMMEGKLYDPNSDKEADSRAEMLAAREEIYSDAHIRGRELYTDWDKNLGRRSQILDYLDRGFIEPGRGKLSPSQLEARRQYLLFMDWNNKVEHFDWTAWKAYYKAA
jgi:hypothetical protein